MGSCMLGRAGAFLHFLRTLGGDMRSVRQFRYMTFLILVAACGGGGDEPPASHAPPSRSFHALQVMALSDSMAAADARDSLVRAGWAAFVDRRPDSLWAVRVNPSPDSLLAEATRFALRRQGRETFLVVDSGSPPAMMVLHMSRVNQATAGMITRPRWARSPDGHTLLLVDDPAGVENEPVPNAVFAGSDGNLPPFRMDSVWDVAPSPDWFHLAVGGARVMSAHEADTLPTAEWDAAASEFGITADSARRASFPASGMSMMFGLARPGVVDLRRGQVRWFDAAGGWQVGWDRQGDTVLAGLPGERVADDARARGWIAFPATGGAPAPSAAPAEPTWYQWTDGPTVDISVPPDTGLRKVKTDAGTLESRGGWIRLDGRILAPGVALTGTRDGRWVAALVPDPAAKEYEAGYYLAVLEVRSEK